MDGGWTMVKLLMTAELKKMLSLKGRFRKCSKVLLLGLEGGEPVLEEGALLRCARVGPLLHLVRPVRGLAEVRITKKRVRPQGLALCVVPRIHIVHLSLVEDYVASGRLDFLLHSHLLEDLVQRLGDGRLGGVHDRDRDRENLLLRRDDRVVLVRRGLLLHVGVHHSGVLGAGFLLVHICIPATVGVHVHVYHPKRVATL